MQIIAFSGRSGSGKSTIANFIQTECGAQKHSFATVLREELVEAGFPRDLVYAKPTPPEIRDLLQAWGAARRAQHEDYLVDVLWSKLEKSLAQNNAGTGPGIVVIDDMRYPNEIIALQAFERVFGVSVKLIRVIADWPSPVSPHHSEFSLDSFVEFTDIFKNKYTYWDELESYALSLIEEDVDGTNGTDHAALPYEQGKSPGSGWIVDAKHLADDTGSDGSSSSSADTPSDTGRREPGGIGDSISRALSRVSR